MSCELASNELFLNCLSKKNRSEKDITTIQDYISQQAWGSQLSIEDLQDLSLHGRLRRCEGGTNLYKKGDRVGAWFLLLRGSLIIGKVLFTSHSCFGKSEKLPFRTESCLILENSDVIMVENSDNDSLNKNYSLSNNHIDTNHNNNHNNNSHNNNNKQNFQKPQNIVIYHNTDIVEGTDFNNNNDNKNNNNTNCNNKYYFNNNNKHDNYNSADIGFSSTIYIDSNDEDDNDTIKKTTKNSSYRNFKKRDDDDNDHGDDNNYDDNDDGNDDDDDNEGVFHHKRHHYDDDSKTNVHRITNNKLTFKHVYDRKDDDNDHNADDDNDYDNDEEGSGYKNGVCSVLKMDSKPARFIKSHSFSGNDSVLQVVGNESVGNYPLQQLQQQEQLQQQLLLRQQQKLLQHHQQLQKELQQQVLQQSLVSPSLPSYALNQNEQQDNTKANNILRLPNNNNNYTFINNNNTNNNYNNNKNYHNSDTSSYHSDNLSSFIESAIDSEMNLADEDGEDDDDEYEGDDYDADKKITGLGSGVVSEALMKSLVGERTEEGVEVIYSFIKHVPALASLSAKTKKELSRVVKMGKVEGEKVVVMKKGQQMDSWGMLLSGYLEVMSEEEEEGGGVEIKDEEDEEEEGRILEPGNCFGVEASEKPQFYTATTRTASKQCFFLLVPQLQYATIMHSEDKDKREIVENGEVVAVMEEKEEAGERKSVLIRATPDHLLKELFEASGTPDPTYLDTFLLTYRTFFKFATQLAYKLMDFFDAHKSKVVSILLTWISSFPEDFDQDPHMNTFMQHLSTNLLQLGMEDEMNEVDAKFASVSKAREVVILRRSREEELPYHVINHPSLPSATFITHVDEKGAKLGLRVGDEILEVNKRSFGNILNSQALSLMTSQTHLCLVVKYNRPGLKKMLLLNKEHVKDDAGDSTGKQTIRTKLASSRGLPPLHALPRVSTSQPPSPLISTAKFRLGGSHNSECHSASHESSPNRPSNYHALLLPSTSHLPLDLEEDNSNSKVIGRIRDSWAKLWMPKSNQQHLQQRMPSKGRFTSQPDLSSLHKNNSNNANNNNNTTNLNNKYNTIRNIADGSYVRNDRSSNRSDKSAYSSRQSDKGVGEFELIQVFKEDQSFKFILVDKFITAKQAVMLVLQEFGMVHKNSLDYSLYMISLQENGCIKQSRLPDHMNDLSHLSTLRSRYYLKNMREDTVLLPDHLVDDFKKECQIRFLSLTPSQIALQLTLSSHQCYRNIKRSEFINQLFNLESSSSGAGAFGGGSKNSTLEKSSSIQSSASNGKIDALQEFSKLPNKEFFWVVTHICAESSLSTRAKSIRHFIHIAKHCLECKNYHSAFNIISGLGHQSVSRLRHTWEKLSDKSNKLFEEMQALLNPSRNMHKYRSLLASRSPPLIPFYPMVMKDLTAIELNHKTRIDGLVNLQKLRMLAKEVNKFKAYAPADVALSEATLSTQLSGDKNPMLTNPSMVGGVVLNAKKLYEGRQMAKRVREYLAGVTPIEDEAQLAEMSNCCEAGTLQRYESSVAVNKINSTSKFSTSTASQLKKLQGLSSDSKSNLLSLSKLRKSVENLSSASSLHSSSVSVSISATDKISFTTSNAGKKEAGFKLLNIKKHKERTEENRPSKLTKRHIETDSGRFSYSGDDGSVASSNQGSPPSANRPSLTSNAPPRPPQPNKTNHLTRQSSQIPPVSSNFGNFYQSNSVSESAISAIDSKKDNRNLQNNNNNNFKEKHNTGLSHSNHINHSDHFSGVRVSINQNTNMISFQTKPPKARTPVPRKPPSGRLQKGDCSGLSGQQRLQIDLV